MKKFIGLNKKSLLVLPFLSLIYHPLAAHVASQHQHHTSALLAKKSPTIHFTIERVIDKNNKKLVFFKLTDSDNQPVLLNDLKEVHTQKIHLLVIDDSLSDYSHVHPEPTQEPGVYQFEWQPLRKNTSYRAWADLVPIKSNTQEYVIADLSLPKETSTTIKINSQPFYESTVNGYRFQLSFDKTTLKVGQPAMGKITVTDNQGKPVHSLEPIMGAFAHIVGFNDDLKTVVHIHPMGQEPSKTMDRGGPVLQFHIEPEKVGFTKVFAQVKINGQELFVPFGITVVKENS